MPAAIFSMKELREMTLMRRANKFDVNIVVSGARGNSKSSFLFKFLLGIPGFKPWKHQVYGRKHVMHLLESQKRGIVFDDEAVSSGFKRDFYELGQKKLIKMLNMYRDNFNIYCSAIPQFYSLDRALRDLVKIHIHMIRRGMGVIHFSNSDRLYSDDMWDVKYNKKIEESWAKKIKSNPNFHPPYHRLSTFKGYIVFGDLQKKQRELYEEIKQTKRKILYNQELRDSGEMVIESTADFVTRILMEGDIPLNIIAS